MGTELGGPIQLPRSRRGRSPRRHKLYQAQSFGVQRGSQLRRCNRCPMKHRKMEEAERVTKKAQCRLTILTDCQTAEHNKSQTRFPYHISLSWRNDENPNCSSRRRQLGGLFFLYYSPSMDLIHCCCSGNALEVTPVSLRDKNTLPPLPISSWISCKEHPSVFHLSPQPMLPCRLKMQIQLVDRLGSIRSMQWRIAGRVS